MSAIPIGEIVSTHASLQNARAMGQNLLYRGLYADRALLIVGDEADGYTLIAFLAPDNQKARKS